MSREGGPFGEGYVDDPSAILMQELESQLTKWRLENDQDISALAAKTRELPDFALRRLARRKLVAKNLDEDESENPDLKKILNNVLQFDLSKQKIVESMAIFSKHQSFLKENGEVRECFLPDGEFVKYIISKIPQDPNNQRAKEKFLNFLYNIFEVFYEASKAKYKGIIADFFLEYPPIGEDLLCEGGTSSRGEIVLQKIRGSLENKYFLSAHIDAFNGLTRKISDTANRGNIVHIPLYLEWILSLEDENVIKKIDANYNTLVTSTPIPVVLDCCIQYSQLFKNNLIKIIDPEELRKGIVRELDLLLNKVAPDMRFLDGKAHILQGYGTQEEGSWVMQINQNIRNKFLLPEDFQALTYDTTEDGDNIFTVTVFNKDRVIEAILQKRLSFMLKEIEAANRESGLKAGADVEFSIFSEKSAEIIKSKLQSSDPQRILEAVEAVCSLSFPSLGGADQWFVRLVEESGILDYESIIKNILPEHFWKVERIRSRLGVLAGIPRFADVKAQQNQASKVMPYIFCSGSTEEIVGLINERSETIWFTGSESAEGTNALYYSLLSLGKIPDSIPRNLGFGFDFEQIFKSICLRQDALEIIKAFSAAMRKHSAAIIPSEVRFLLLRDSLVLNLKDIWQELLSVDQIVDDKDYTKFLSIAAQKGCAKIIADFLGCQSFSSQYKFQSLAKKDYELQLLSPFEYIAINGDLESLDVILKSDIAAELASDLVEQESSSLDTIIEAAIIHGNPQIVEKILESKAFQDRDIECLFRSFKDRNGRTILDLIARIPQSASLINSILTSQRITKDTKKYLLNISSPFLEAASAGCSQAIEVLLASDEIEPRIKLSMIKKLTHSKESFLDCAVIAGRVEIVLKILDESDPLKIGAKIRKFLLNNKNEGGKNFLSLAAACKQSKVFIAILESDFLSQLQKEKLLRQVDSNGESILHHLVKSDENHEALNFLFRSDKISSDTKRFLLMAKSSRKNTVLHAASFYGSSVMFPLILQHADKFGLKEYLINYRNKSGENFFHAMSAELYFRPKSKILAIALNSEDISKADKNRLLLARNKDKDNVLDINAKTIEDQSAERVKIILENPNVTPETVVLLTERANFFSIPTISKVIRREGKSCLLVTQCLMSNGAYLPRKKGQFNFSEIKERLNLLARFIEGYVDNPDVNFAANLGAFFQNDATLRLTEDHAKILLNSRNKRGFNAMHLAALNPQVGFEQTQHLIQIGGRCDICTKDKRNFMHLALDSKNYGALAAVIKNFDAKDIITKAIAGSENSLQKLFADFYSNLELDLKNKFKEEFLKWFEEKVATLDNSSIKIIADNFEIQRGVDFLQDAQVEEDRRFKPSSARNMSPEKAALIEEIKNKLSPPSAQETLIGEDESDSKLSISSPRATNLAADTNRFHESSI